MAITDAQQAKQIMMKKGGPVVQAGVKNYKPSKMVTVPKIAKSSPTHPTAKLAYITDAEKKLLIKKNLHGSLKGKPNRGPGGIPSLQGDFGPGGGGSYSEAGTGRDVGRDDQGRTTIGGDINRGRDVAADRRARAAQINRSREAAARREAARKREIAREATETFNQREKERKAKQKKTTALKNLEVLPGLFEDDEEDVAFEEADLNKDGKVGRIEKFNYNKRKAKQKAIKDRIDKKIRSGLELVDPNINLTRSIKEMEMNMPTASYGDLVKEAVLGGSTFGNTGELIGAEFEKYSPKEGSAQEKYNYQPDFFSPIQTTSPSLTVQGAAGLANLLGGALMNKTPYEGKMTELADLYDKAAGLDLSKTSTTDMMRDFEPNRYALANNMIYDPIRKTFSPKPDGDGGGQLPLLPIQQAGAGDSKDKDEDEEDPFQLALAFRKDGGRVPYEDGGYTGGIMDLESGRQMYFLGKLVKKATRAVKKVVKSPLGKAALLGLGAYYMPGFGIKASGGFSPFMKKFGFDAIKKKIGEASFGKLAGLSIGGGLLAGALAGKGYEDEDGDGFDDNTGFSVDEYRKRGAQGNVPIAFRAEGGMSDVESDPQYKGWKRIFEVNPDAAEMHPKHKEFVKYYRSTERETRAEGGMMDLKGMEMDFREDGGFVPIGKKERADDVPARLSKNEFVMTADAVRGAGDGDIDKGAQKMYNLMSKLEAENDQSQGLDGARKMFQTAKRLEEVL